ncbi:ANTAR domain-containing protein [Amycolatopsis sp. VS8301801F10]|uniref:ANTAR domain-containing protein n=1 Tax=Amycolatopsis sp. VS8301801F10 TaxID=2652442 RepID=UPI0038FD0E16
MLEQAKGIAVARQQVPPDEASELLRQSSQHTNVKLRRPHQSAPGLPQPSRGTPPGKLTGSQ